VSLHDIVRVTQFVAIILAVVIVLAGLYAYWYLKIRKKKRVKEEEINYDELVRKDSIDFCKFDDIRDDMIITDGGTRFIGIIKARGFDYFQSRASEQNMTEGGYGMFINSITQPITFRQYTKAVDLDGVRENYKNAYDRTEQMLFNLNEDFNRLTSQYYDLKSEDKLTDEIEWELLSQCENLASKIEVYDYRRLHLADNLNYIDQVSKVTSPEKVQTYVYDWTYDPLMGVSDLTDAEIHKKAITELKRKGDAYIHALGNAGVRASRVRNDELVQMMRRHFHPLTANVFTAKDFEASNYYEEITSSSGLKESDYELAMQEGVLEQVQDQQDKVYNEMIERGVDAEVADKIMESYDIEALGAFNTEDENNRTITSGDIEERKKEILTNKFEEREKKRIKEEKAREEKEKRVAQIAPAKESKKDEQKDHIFTGLSLDFDMPDEK
jgi:hypothetical protein